MSPLWSCSRIETVRLLTLPPTHVEPSEVWMSNAKSRSEAPSGSFRRSPLGVKTKISPEAGLASKRCASECVVSSNSSRRRPSHISLVWAPWLTPL